MVRQQADDIQLLKDEVKRLRGHINSVTAGSQILSIALPPFDNAPGRFFAQTDDATVGNQTGEASLLATGIGSVDFDADFLTVGQCIRLEARGYLSSTATGPALQIRVRLGGTAILDTGAQILSATAMVDREWRLDALLTVRTIGGAGTIVGQGFFSFMDLAGTAGAPTYFEMSMVAGPATIDTTSGLGLDVSAEWDTADPANTITATNLLLSVG